MSALAGTVLALRWWSDFVDDTVGVGLAREVFGQDGEGPALAALAMVRHPLRRIADRHPRSDMVLRGGRVVLSSSVGRSVFRHLYEYAGDTNIPLIGFSTFALQAFGNTLLVALLFCGDHARRQG